MCFRKVKITPNASAKTNIAIIGTTEPWSTNTDCGEGTCGLGVQVFVAVLGAIRIESFLNGLGELSGISDGLGTEAGLGAVSDGLGTETGLGAVSDGLGTEAGLGVVWFVVFVW